MNEKNPIEVLLSDSDENIILYNEEGEPVEFEQIALIPIEEGEYSGRLFAILRPLEDDDLEADEAIVYELGEDGDDATLTPVEEEGVLRAVFGIYYSMLQEAGVQL